MGPAEPHQGDAMTDRLVLDERHKGISKYRLSWYLADEGDIGGTLGPHYSTADLETAKNSEDREVAIACLAAGESPDCKRDHDGYYWDDKKTAASALRFVKHALKTDGGPPWPEWAIKAVAAGWRAPKGWRPQDHLNRIG